MIKEWSLTIRENKMLEENVITKIKSSIETSTSGKREQMYFPYSFKHNWKRWKNIYDMYKVI